jgi:translation initiation factor 2-alpha kinase 3
MFEKSFVFLKIYVQELLKLTNHVMKGLKKLHEENFVHRDLKPSNIFLTENGVYKLGLFQCCYLNDFLCR